MVSVFISIIVDTIQLTVNTNNLPSYLVLNPIYYKSFSDQLDL